MEHPTQTEPSKTMGRVSLGSCELESIYTVVPGDDCGGGCTVSIPNAVTPNVDGINDGLLIFLTPGCGSVESVTLWDKWGEMQYQTNSANLGPTVWNGMTFLPGFI